MKRLPLAFFTVATIYALCGMVWGMIMAKSEDFTQAPAHAHLNLLGWTTMGIMGGFYALAGERAPIRLGWTNFGLSTVGVIITIPALSKLLAGDKAIVPVVATGSGICFLGMLVFFASILTLWRTPKRA